MSQVLQVRCPQCQTKLRIPAAWMAQPVRCKHCQAIFQGKAPPSDAIMPARAVAPAAAAAVAAGQPAKPRAARRPGHERRPPHDPRIHKSPMKPLPAALLVSALCGAIVFAGHFSWVLMRGERPEDAQHARKDADDSPQKQAGDGASKSVEVGQKDPGTGADTTGNSVTPPPVKENKENKQGPKENKENKEGPNPVDPPPEKSVKTNEPDPKKFKRPDPIVPPQFKEDPMKIVELAKPPGPNDPFPRRALLVSVNDYLLWNPVSHGNSASAKSPSASSSTTALVELLTKPPFSIADDQITELSDGMPADPKSMRQPRDPLKQVVKDTIDDFLNTSRPQDRVILLFAGHAMDGDKECYLVPLEGNSNDVNSLIPLSWLYERLAACKAKQKLLILDVCRFPQSVGLERPGEEEMSEQLDTLLLNPPAGVQVWSSCRKGQKSYELARGGVFLEALCAVLQKDFPRSISLQNQQLPLSFVVPEVDLKMKEILDPLALVQVSRLTGFLTAENNPANIYNAEEKMPARLAIAAPKVEGGEVAAAAQVNEIVEEIKRLPPARTGQTLPRTLPTFSAKALAEYKADYPSWEGVKDVVAKEPEKYPLRKAVFDAVKAMDESQKMQIVRRIPNPKGGPIDPKVKNSFQPAQKDAALRIYALLDELDKLKAAGESRDKESKRWQATYDFTVARMHSRILYIYEYNYLLGSIRLDQLPELEAGKHNGWTLVSRKEPQVLAKEAKVKDLVKQMKRAWKKVTDEHPDTPWAVIAAREQLSAMGLEWKGTKE